MKQLTEDQLAQVPDEFALTSTNLDMEYWGDGPGGDIIIQYGYQDKWYLQGNGFRERELDNLGEAFDAAIEIMRGEYQ